MADSVMLDTQGPDWPLGVIVVATPGTPVNIMSLVDSASVNAPNTATTVGTAKEQEYTARCNQIQFQAFKKGSSHGLALNTGNIYIVRQGVQGAGNRDDYGAIVWVLQPGQTWSLGSPAANRNGFSPYRYYIDADNASDAALVTLVIG